MADPKAPTWDQLPESTRNDFTKVRLGAHGTCDRQWYESLLPEHRVGALNAYAGMKSTGLWGHVESLKMPTRQTPAEDAGKFDFIAKDTDGLRERLARRPDFSDPGPSAVGWSARDDSLAASMHIQQYGTNRDYVQVHFDKSGLSANPITWLPHLFLDAIGSGYQDVHTIRELQLDKGLDWSRPVMDPTVIGDYPPPRVGGHGPTSAPVPERLASFTWRAHEAARLRPGARPGLGTLQISGLPSRAGTTPPWRRRTDPSRPPTLPAPRRAYDFSVRELPGPVRTLPGGRLEFPGAQVVARPRPNLLRDLGDRLEHMPPAPARRFDWTAGPVSHSLAGNGPASVPGLRLTATPRPNLLRELGDRLQGSPGYRWGVRQEPGAMHRLPGGGVEFPPIHVVATPTNHSYLANLAAGLR